MAIVSLNEGDCGLEPLYSPVSCHEMCLYEISVVPLANPVSGRRMLSIRNTHPWLLPGFWSFQGGEGNIFLFLPRNQIAEAVGLAPNCKILFDENDCSFMQFWDLLAEWELSSICWCLMSEWCGEEKWRKQVVIDLTALSKNTNCIYAVSAFKTKPNKTSLQISEEKMDYHSLQLLLVSRWVSIPVTQSKVKRMFNHGSSPWYSPTMCFLRH